MVATFPVLTMIHFVPADSSCFCVDPVTGEEIADSSGGKDSPMIVYSHLVLHIG